MDSPATLSAASQLEAALPLLASWMPHQRWYVHKSASAPQLRVLGHVVLSADNAQLVALAAVEALTDSAAGSARTIYQMPLLLTDAASAVDMDPEAVIGDLPAETGQPSLQIIDALRSDVGRRAIGALLAGSAADGPGLSVQPRWSDDAPLGEVTSTRILRGEQSNTSVILERAEGPAVIAKIFRVLQDGENPDAVVQEALHGAGNLRIAPLAGTVVGTVADDLTTHLVFAQHFLPGVEDAWRVALHEAAAGRDFTAAAHALGAATAEVHRDLAAAMPVQRADEAAREAMVEQMRERIAQVSSEVPQVAQVRARLEGIVAQARELPWPDLQRIHGDFHLGQVLATPESGWILLDFEGEPLRPLAQRTAPDSPLRDVAGMLRSLDYAAGSVLLTDGIDASQWAAEARAAFWEGYAGTLALDPRDEDLLRLVAVFEADKAVYEALYEARNRPDWLPIPLGAIERITRR